ncbi:2Fe-2S iron-sulfur cluster-binding protein [Arsenicibacter rosenii]|uniref:Oxidoreductase n=1 Tax=Arsenicibacter rosenii TaxID=1750698 RepID=A0A1S2VCL3_9BACT|nr:2Fe-2S iron-sulfur cluster-binding protein [Arsenicibacter rosenii]OIN56160.1 oxidoreductase [Arsenicibacter rosenii]
MTNTLHLRITHIQAETADTNSYYLESVDGQPVAYLPGQFLTVILHPKGGEEAVEQEVRRSYSISSVPGEPLRMTIKRVENGAISRYLLNTLRPGDVIECLAPAGRFTLNRIEDKEPQDLLFIAAGSGITPVLSLIKAALTTTTAKLTLLYSNTRERGIIFREELNNLADLFPDRLQLVHLLSHPTQDGEGLKGTVRTGRLNNVLLETLLPTLLHGPLAAAACFVCGPGDYMRMVQFTLVFSGMRAEQIHRENFVVEPVFVSAPPVQSADRIVRLLFAEKELSILVPAYKSILQAALDEGVSLPYSCRGGRCSTCAGRCTSGQVHMTINDVLTERDLQQGWVLTCTGYPESDDVVIEF